MKVKTGQARPYPGTVAFVGPHRDLVTARSVPSQVFDAAVVSTVSDDPWASLLLDVVDGEPGTTSLSGRDFSLFLDAVRAEEPNDSLRQAVARRVVAAR